MNQIYPPLNLSIYFSNLSPREIEREIRSRTIIDDDLKKITKIAGTDTAYHKKPGSKYQELAATALVVLSFPDLEYIESSIFTAPAAFPYIPGDFALREAPHIIEAVNRLDSAPDLLITDGHGIAHPRECGLACHVGVITCIPTIGTAKSLLAGRHLMPGTEKGSLAPLFLNGKQVGHVVRTQINVKPVYVSPGHRISTDTAAEIVLAASPRYRIPEPVRLAHQEARRALKKYIK